ncbi:magnesium/cobalt transporter CorA [Marinifilum sp. D714]|uniref:magnesium/cobalt transporter CorA n=1 Tax=Marinifilum sp. D714 TaxID=2937523 RepID=UPI0027BE6502|nr:magnesium/cobalt transporter CorA [Marinifilum sp. D714]MDQ2178773.1 magnesium/cobalt transporter CorA [Marinifilum sp. D714]
MGNKKLKRNSTKKGMSPGTLIHIGKQRVSHASIQIVKYNEDSIQFEEFVNELSNINFPKPSKDHVTWINLKGVDIPALENIGKQFNIHDLVLEDILNNSLRPKFEVFQDYYFLSIKMVLSDSDELTYGSVPVHFILGESYILSFIDFEDPIFDSALFRLRNQPQRIRSKGADYLLFALADVVIDNYFELIEIGNDKLEKLDDEISIPSNEDIPNSIREYRRVLLRARRGITPVKETYSILVNDDLHLIKEENVKYFRDTKDHILFIIDQMDFLRDNLSAINESYQSIQDNQLNQVMKLLTLIATIFIPLTFLAGIYGMNFSNMPELNYKYGYYILLGVMFLVAIFMIVWFKKKKWM